MRLHLYHEFVCFEALLPDRLYRHPPKLLKIIEGKATVFVAVHHKKHAEVAHIEPVLVS